MSDAKLPHAQGTPCWVDLMTGDQAEALRFYRSLLGWAGEPGGPQVGGYAVLSLDGRAVAGIGTQPEDQGPSVPAWTTYFAADDIAAAAERVGVHGGRVFVGPERIDGVGRLALGTDPGGAVFGLWQPEPFPGFQATDEPGAPVWFERVTTRGKMAAAFYSAVFDIEIPPMEQMPDEYWLVTVDGAQVAGIWDGSGSAIAEAGSRWQPYFKVADTDAAVTAALAGGGVVVRAAQDSPYGRLAALADPQGAHFSVISEPAA